MQREIATTPGASRGLLASNDPEKSAVDAGRAGGGRPPRAEVAVGYEAERGASPPAVNDMLRAPCVASETNATSKTNRGRSSLPPARRRQWFVGLAEAIG
jgi:hypothetical protein